MTFQRRAAQTPVAGNTRGEWIDFAVLWAAVRFTTATEAIRLGQPENITAGVVFVRTNSYSRDITAAMRVVVEGRVFAIRGIKPPERRAGEIEIAIESAA